MASGRKLPDSPTKMTQFAPLSSDSKPTGGFFSRLFKKNNEDGDSASTSSREDSPGGLTVSSRDSPVIIEAPSLSEPDRRDSEVSQGSVDSSSTISESGVPASISATQPRTHYSVLKRLSNILDRRSQTPQAYKDSDFKQYWMPDSNCKQCYECSDKFNTFRRRHHCRICGQIFCSRCCNQEVPGKIMGYTGYLRVCTYCCKVVLSYAQNPEATGDLGTLSEDLHDLSAAPDAETTGTSPSQGQTGGQGQDMEWVTPSKRKARQMTTHSIFEGDLSKQRTPTAEIATTPSKINPYDLTPLGDLSEIPSFLQERKILTQESAQLKEIWVQMQHPIEGMEMQSHRHRLRTYPNCLVGNQIVDWLISRDKAADRVQAIGICQGLVDAKWLESITGGDVFRDEYVLYRPGEAALKEGSSIDVTITKETTEIEDDEPAWFREIKREDEREHVISAFDNKELNKIPSTISGPGEFSGEGSETSGEHSSVFYVDHREGIEFPNRRPKKLKSSTTSADRKGSISAEGSSASLTHQDSSITNADDIFRGALPLSEDTVTMNLDINIPDGWQSSEHLKEDNGERLAFDRLSKAHHEQMKSLTNQLLSAEGLSIKWADTIMTVVRKISQVVRPDVRHEGDDMDIRQYVQIKKIPGGLRSQSSIVCGVVCTKNVTNKRMRQHILNPKILLLRASIEYQRVENKFSSLEPQILQEHEFLRNCVARIAALEPDILMVEKSVSRVAQDFILDSGITLILNTKPSVMERVSRFTQADIVPSVDSLVSKTSMGFCHTFKTQNYNLPDGSSKTLMYFDGCASHLGCTVTLRGGSENELKRVKHVLQFMTYIAYHSKLEISFLMDEFGMPPPAPDEMGEVLDEPPQKAEVPSAESVKEQSTVRRETTDFVFSTMKSSLVEMERSTDDLESPSSPVQGQKTFSQGQGQTADNQHFNTSEAEGNTVPMETSDSNVKTETSHSEGDAVHIGESGGVSVPNNQSKSETDAGNSDQKLVSGGRQPAPLVRNTSTQVLDFSDPLQNYQKSQDESIFARKGSLHEITQNNSKRFRKALDDVILSCSPYIRAEIPYLETDAGSKCVLRPHFPPDVYWSRHFEPEKNTRKSRIHETPAAVTETKPPGDAPFFAPAHPFISEKLTGPVTEGKTQALLADFRARGGRIMWYGDKEDRLMGFGMNGGILRKKEMVEEERESSPYNWDRRTDCLDTEHHQRIAVLFSSFSYLSANAPNPCVNPWTVSMDFYGRNDIPFGSFLERYCFRESYQCPSESCDTPMVDHVRRFVHETGCLQIVLKKLDVPIPGYQNNILMWGWCRKCKQVTPVVPMSLDTWSMSFAKYLELRYHGNLYTRRAGAHLCNHALHHDHYQYFGCKQIVASFKYFPIQLKEICLPPMVIDIVDQGVSLQTVIDKVKVISFKGTGVYSTVTEHLHRLKRDAQTEAQASLIAEYISQIQLEKDQFRCKMDVIQTIMSHVTSPTHHQVTSLHKPEFAPENVTVTVETMFEIDDAIVEVKRQVAEAVCSWNNRIQDFEQQQKKLERGRSSGAMGALQSNSSNRSSRDMLDTAGASDVRQHSATTDDVAMETDDTRLTVATDDRARASSDVTLAYQPDSSPRQGTAAAAAGGEVGGPEGSTAHSVHFPPSLQDRPRRQASNQSIESEGSLERSQDDADGIYRGQGHQRSKSLGEPKKMAKQLSVPHDMSAGELDRMEKTRDRSSVKTIFSSLLSSAETTAVNMPFSADEHHLLGKCEKVPIIVYDQEPSSIIAYTLSSPEYERELAELKAHPPTRGDSSGAPSPNISKNRRISGDVRNTDNLEPETNTTSKKGSSVLSFLRGNREKSPSRLAAPTDIDTVRYTPRPDRDSMDDNDEFSYFSGQEQSDKSKTGKSNAPNYNIELQFSDSTAKFYCRVYYAEQFKKLRKLIFPAGEKRYIRSLSRCFTWLASGGKSGSTFCKTQDDRFILKQMSRFEVQSFVEFAPHYFQYITKAHNEQKPTVLAKILGVYRIGYRNSQTNMALKQDLLVIENLFYDRNVKQIFDLKGSTRKRLVNTSGKRVEDLVLLDENLLKLSVDSPLYIRPHSKTVLTLAITNDTSFLSSNLVMDYSLLVGLDEQKKELVIGIIDYIRTFTWDKKLEMVFKTTYSQLGGQGKMPTVVSPELYRSRFLEAMDRYFLLVPDRWAGLGRSVDS